MAENNTMEVNRNAEETQVVEVKEKKPIGVKIKEGASKVWSVVKTPLIIGGSLLLGAGIALTGVAYERAMTNEYDPGCDPEPDCDPEPIEGEYTEKKEE